MQLKFKKIFLFATVFIYFASFLLQSNLSFFQALAKEKNEPRVNIVAILVDNKIYDEISSDLKRYASDYVQQKLSDTKALVIPLDLTNIHAYDIYRMMENIYFDGLKDVNSSLIWLVMFGDIPLPVVNQDWYIFPTVYPYVDFENQKYIWDPEIQYFVPNENPEWQAEIWHWLINYGSDIKAYSDFFGKIKSYVKNPDDFIWDSIWYDDFVAQKEWFLNENLPYYRNKIMFAEDLWYQRFSPLMRNIFRWDQTENAIDIVTELESAANLNFSWKELLSEMSDQWLSESHTTKMVQQEIQTSFLSDYNELFWSTNMSTMRENVFAWWRWIKEYKDGDGKKSLIGDVDSNASKLQIKDDVLLWNENFKWLIESMNDLMEEMVDKKIADNKYDMDIVIPVSYENEGREKFRRSLRRRCISFPTRYDNYYFWLNARNVDSAKDLSIYRWTYRNLENLNWLTYNSLEKWYNPVVWEYDSTNPKLKSIWASFDIFASQVEWNRWYSMFVVENDLEVWDQEKKNKDAQYRRVFKNKVNDKFWPVCNNSDQNNICEDLFTFWLRWWWWASPIFLDADSVSSGRYQLSGYKATDSWRSVFDMWGFQSLLPWLDEWDSGTWWVDWKWKWPQKAWASFKAYIKYSSPTERVWWEDKNWTKWSSMPFARYVNNTPDIHGMSFSGMNYWENKFVSDNKWQMSRESQGSTIFTIALKPQFYNNSCNYYPSGLGRTIRWEKYTYKVISSIVKHVSTTEDEINWVDRNRYWEWWILEWYYVNLKNSYNNVDKNVTDIVSLLNSVDNSNIKREIENLSGKIAEIEWLDDEIQTLEELLENASEDDYEWIRNMLVSKQTLKANVDVEISRALNSLSGAIENDKRTLVDVYSAITSLSVDEIVSSLEMIAKEEWIDPEKFYNKEGNLTKIWFSKGWISEFAELESDIKKGINSILTSYSAVFVSINEQKKKWNLMKSKQLGLLSEVHSDKIEAISKDMDNIFNISLLLAEDDNYANSNDPEEKEDIILKWSTAESIIEQGQNVSCPKIVTSEDDNISNENEDDTVWILVKFDGECGINKMFNWLIEEDTKGPAIVAAAKGDKDFILWLKNNSINTKTFTSDDWINQYVQWTKWPWYDSEWAKKNYSLLLWASEHMSWMNLLTPDRPIDSPRYVSMQSIAWNEINFIYPDLFKVEVYTSKWKNKSGYDIHELLTQWEIKNNLVKYLNWKVYEYNKIIEKECKNAELKNAFSDEHYKQLQNMGYDSAVPDAWKHGCNAKFLYGEFVEALWWEKMLDVISQALYYQSLTNTTKLSSEKIEEDIELIKKSFNLNDKRRQILKDYLTWWNEKSKNLILEIPTYSVSWYEVAFINSDWRDYIFSEDKDSVESTSRFDNDFGLYSNSNWNRQPNQQEKSIDDECNIPTSWKLPLFKMNWTSPWFEWFNCWLKQTLKSPLKVKLTFGSSLWDILSSDSLQDFIKDSDIGQSFIDWWDDIDEYGDSWDDLLDSTGWYDSDKIITQMQVNAEKHNKAVIWWNDWLSNLLSSVYKNIRIANETSLLSDSNPSSELKIESVSDVGNITVEFVGTWDWCLKIDSHDLCNGKTFKKTFNPKNNPFTWIVVTADHVAWKVGLIMKISVWWWYIENIIKYTVSPSNLDHIDINFGSVKSIAWMMTPVEFIWYDRYNNKISWWLEKYDFTVSQWRFYKDWVYQSGFSTNDFRNLKFYYQAPLDAVDWSVVTLQVSHNGNIVKTYNQPISQASPVIKMNWKIVLQWKGQLKTSELYKLRDDENIYVWWKLETNKLQKIEVAIMDSQWKIADINGQVLVKSQKWLIKVWQVNKQGNWNSVFSEVSKISMKSWYALIYFYPTTVAGDDRITIDIPWLDTRVINFSIKPGDSRNIMLNLANEYVSLDDKNDLEISVSDVWWNPTNSTVKIISDPRNVELKWVTEVSRSDDVVVSSINVNGHTKISVDWIWAWSTIIQAWFDSKQWFVTLADVEFAVDDDLLPETWLNVMYLNYFWNDRWNQWWYLSNNKKRIESMMKSSNKIITTTTLLTSENKIKKVLWKIDPWLKVMDFGGVDTTATINQWDLNMLVWWLSEMNLSLPSFEWMTATFDSITTLLNNQKNSKNNYIFFVPGETEYEIKNWMLYDSDVRVASVKDGDVLLQYSDRSLDNWDNVWNVVYKWTNYGALIMHFPALYPKISDFKELWWRYSVGNLFVWWSTDMMYGVGIFDWLSEFELYTNYKSIQNSNDVDERIWFLWDFKNITLFAEWEIVGEATRKYWSEFLINLWDPVLSRKDVNEKVYGTNYDWWIWKEIYTDPEKDIFGVYQIDFNNDWLKDWLVVYQDWVFNLVKNYGWSPDLREMQELMRIAVRTKNVFVWDADGNGYEDIFVLTENDQIRVYLNNWWKFDVDWNVACLNQNVFEWEVSEKPSDLEWLNQFFVEDMDMDWVVDIVTYDEKWYIKVFYGGSTNQGPNYLSTEKYACDTWWYSREAKNITIVTALWIQISEEDIFDNSMIHWVGMSKPEIEISSNDLSKYWVNFDPDSLNNLINTDDIKGSIDKITKEVMSSDKFDVGVASSQFIQDEAKFQDVTLYENTLVGATWDSKNYVFVASSFLDPNNPQDKCSVRKNYRNKEWRSILMNKDVVTVKVTIKASDDTSCVWSFWDIIQWPWTVYYDESGKLKWIRFLQNQKNAVVKSKDWIFSYLVDNITLSPWEKMVFEYDLEYKSIPLKKMSITHKTFWSDDDYPDIKLQSVDWCEKNFDGFINSHKRSFQNTVVPLQELINKEYEEENDNTKDYATDLSNYWWDISKLPWLVWDRINRVSLLWNQPINISNNEEWRNNLRDAIFSEAWIALNIDLDFFSEQTDAIENAIDDIMQWMCNWFSFWWSSNCKWLPVPFNQAFLAPGKYHLFGCRELPMGPLEKWLPAFFFPGNLWPLPFVGYLPIPYMPTWPMDSFLWVKSPWWPWSSFIRIYAAPTLTAQLWIAVCMWPYPVWAALPSPFADLWWNCVVFAVKPQCKWWEDWKWWARKNDNENPNEIYWEFVDEVKDSWICLQSQKWSQVTARGYRSSPFNLYSYSSKASNIDSNSRNNFSLGSTLDTIKWKNVDVNWGSNNWIEFDTDLLWIISLETSAYIGSAESESSSQNNSIFIWDIDVLWWDFSVNKIRWWIQQWIRKILIDKWLDPQIRYILNQLTKMHINVKMPDVSKLIGNEVQTLKNITKNVWKKNEDKSDNKGNKSNAEGEWTKIVFNKTNTWFASELWGWSYINSDNLNQINDAISNPFESLASLMNESNILNITIEPITVKIPMISAEDINGYEIYLKQWLDVNEKVINKRKLLLENWDFTGNNVGTVLDKHNIEVSLGDWPKLQNQIYANLMTLQKYRNFPFEIYEWIHVIDRYMAEIVSLINDTIWYLSYWMSVNSQRFVWYVDAIILMMNIIKTYQLLIKFSDEWWKNCGTCTKDTYDQYSCKLAILCNGIQLPIIQIPNFKIPNITIDLSNIDLWLDIILPSFNFKPVNVQLPQLPNLPEPPSFGANFDLKLPDIPMLPEPPDLPELPSFIPEIELELPVLPPAPELPKLPNEIESMIKIAKLIWKIYCIVKWKFGLVWESSVKAKIEQLTQRTYEVKRIDKIMDFTNLSVAPVHNYWLDYEISTQVDLQFEFSSFYNYLDMLTKQINNLTTSSVNWVNDKANDLVNDNIVTWIWDMIDNSNLEFGVEWDLSMSDLSNINFEWLESDGVEYVDYNSAKSRLKDVLAYFVQETKNTTMWNSVKLSVSSIENQIEKANVIEPNIEGLKNIEKDAIDYVDKYKSDYNDLAELINNDYEWFLAMVKSDEINNKFDSETWQLLAYNINLFDVDSSTKDAIKTITNTSPYEALLNNKKTIVDWYRKAINSNTASDLWLSQSQYLVLHDSISSMRDKITTLYSVVKPTSLTKLIAKNSIKSVDKTLVSSAWWWERLWSNMEVASVVDPSVLSEWIYGKIISWADKWKLTKIVYSDYFVSNIWGQYYHTDNTNVDDVVLWDDGSVYLKCVWWTCDNWRWWFKKYYVSKVIDKIPEEEFWINFDSDTKLKIADWNIEIKNWKVDSQGYDDLRFSWYASDTDAYLIKLVERVDNSYEKSDYKYVTTPVIYVLAIPKSKSIDDLYSWDVKLELLRKTEKIEKLIEKDLVQIVEFDDKQDIVDISISNIDRKWYYARIATLNLENNIYKITSPWSNQVVAWKQIVWDDLSPEWNAVLFRPSINQVVSEWDYLDWFVWTKYKLTVNWEDNVALSYISLLKDGKILDEKYTSNSGDSVTTNIGVHTKSETEKYSTVWMDQFGNKTEKIIIIDYSIPEINITEVSKNSDWKTIAVKANLSQDIDQWNVSFQRRRWEVWKTIARKGVKQTEFSLWPKQDVVIWTPYSYDNEIAMYDKNGEVIALMNPVTAEIILQPEYKDNFDIRAIIQNGIVLQIFNKKTNKSVFSMNVPAQSCVKIDASNYNIVDLPETWKMGMFNWWKAIYKDWSNVMYASKNCHLYSDLSVEWTYGFDRELGAVMLTLYLSSDLSKSNPIKVWFKAKPLISE